MTAKASIIICPGGAYRFLSPRESEPVARTFREMGFETEILRYPIREAGEPEPLGLRPLHALADAVKRQRDTHPGLPVYVCGFSAGAHLAATLGVHGRTLGMETPDALILCYPVITADERWCSDESFRNLVGEGEREFFSLEKHVPRIRRLFSCGIRPRMRKSRSKTRSCLQLLSALRVFPLNCTYTRLGPMACPLPRRKWNRQRRGVSLMRMLPDGYACVQSGLPTSEVDAFRLLSLFK